MLMFAETRQKKYTRICTRSETQTKEALPCRRVSVGIVCVKNWRFL